MLDLLKNYSYLVDYFGFAVTLSVFFKLKNIHRAYFLRARLPELQKCLREHANVLSQNLADFSATKAHTLMELSRAEATVEHIYIKCPEIKVSVKPLRKNIQKTKDDTKITVYTVEKLFRQMIAVEEHLKNITQDDKRRQ